MTISDLPPQHDSFDVSERELLPQQEPSTHRYAVVRRMSFGIVTGILAVALIVALIVSLRTSTPSSVAPPKTYHPLIIDQIAIESNVPWGSITIDGKGVAQFRGIHGTNAIQLAHGTHTLTWNAAPFTPQNCTISIPGTSADTCVLGEQLSGAAQPLLPILFTASLQRLPPVQQGSLLQAVQAAVQGLTSTEPILPGEYYQSGLDKATQRLLGTLHFTLDTGSGTCSLTDPSCHFNGQDCHQLCSVHRYPVPLDQPDQIWQVFGVALPQWDYATATGQTIAQNQSDEFGGATAREGWVRLDIRWMGAAWQVTTPPSSPGLIASSDTPITTASPVDIGCASALNTQEEVGSGDPPSLGTTPLHWQYTAAEQRAQGCLVAAIPDSNAATATTPATAYLLWRFGSFVAVNAAAASYWPGMLLADAHERAIAIALGAQV